MNDEGKVVLHIELSADGKLSMNIPDNQILALGLLDYARERFLEEIVRPSLRPKIEVATSLPKVN